MRVVGWHGWLLCSWCAGSPPHGMFYLVLACSQVPVTLPGWCRAGSDEVSRLARAQPLGPGACTVPPLLHLLWHRQAADCSAPNMALPFDGRYRVLVYVVQDRSWISNALGAATWPGLALRAWGA